jgi:perosamine synthetase
MLVVSNRGLDESYHKENRMQSAAVPLLPRQEGAMSRLQDPIPLCVPEICGNELAYLKECVDSGWVSSVGPFVDRFERELAACVGARHAVATVNGTSALHIALLIAGVQPDDEVLVSTLTFIAPANAIRYAGAWPVLVDAEPAYWQMDAQRVADFLNRECQWTHGRLINRATGRRVRAIVPVDILGHPVDIDAVVELARKYELAIVEDATESLGAQYKGRMMGRSADVACFSFNGNKLMTTGGGGMIVTDNPAWAKRAKYLTTQAKDDPVEYIHGEIGYNYRLTNLQAAFGCGQLECLPAFLATKRRTAAAYTEALRDIPGIQTMPAAPWASSSFWLYTVLINEQEYGEDSREVLARLGAQGIQTRPLWQPLHRSPAHQTTQVLGGSVADRIAHDALSLPSSVGLTADQLAAVVAALRPA